MSNIEFEYQGKEYFPKKKKKVYTIEKIESTHMDCCDGVGGLKS